MDNVSFHKKAMNSIRLNLLLWVMAAPCLVAQTAALRGVLTDESGALIPGATVQIRGPSGFEKSVKAQPEGTYSIANIRPGDYTVNASAPQLALPAPTQVSLHEGLNTLDPRLRIVGMAQQVTVEANQPPGLSVDAATNANATVLSGADLDSLSDDPQDLADDLAALAGPSAGS